MTDVVADPDALGDFADLGSARAAMEVEAGDLSGLWSRVANGSPDFGVVGTSLGRLSSLLVDMERQENFAAAVRAAVLAADEFTGRVGRAPGALVDSLLAGAPSGLLWTFDAEIALLATDNGLSYEEAYFVVRTHQIDIVHSLIVDGGPRPGGEAQLLQLIADRNALIDDLTMGDQALTAAMIELLEAGGPGYAADAAFDAPGLVHADSSIDEVLAALDTRLAGSDPPPFDPFLIGLGTTLAVKVEAFTGADASVADPVIAGSAEAMGVTYNEVVALLRAERAEQTADSGPAFIDVAVAGVGEAAALLSDRELFVELETAEIGGPSPHDGRLSMANVDAVLAHPDRFDPSVVRAARYLKDDPDAFAELDAARAGTFLHRLGEGDYHIGRGDGVIAYAEAVEHPTTRWLFETLRSDLANLDGDRDGVLTEAEFTERLADLDVPDDVRTAIEYAVATGVADGGDVRPPWLQVASSTFRIASLAPGAPLNAGRSLVDLGGLNADSLAALRGAGGTILGVARFGYDVGAASPATGLYQIEAWRVDGDLARHRGVLLTQSLPVLYEASASLMPGTSQWTEASEAVRRSGTWDSHAGLNLVRTAVDGETFIEDPGAWIGALAPELLITAFTGGGGAITRTATTASRLSAAGRRYLVSLGRTGARATIRNGLPAATLGLRSLSTLPSRVTARAVGRVERLGEGTAALEALELRMRRYVELHQRRRAVPAPIDFTARRDPFGRWVARRADVDPDGYFDVVAHGNALEIELAGTDHAHLATAADAAPVIRRADGYQQGQPVRLISCATGCLDDGFAARLSQHLDVPVMAADDYLWVTRDGSMVVSRVLTKNGFFGRRLVPDWPPTGGWRLFHPDGRIDTIDTPRPDGGPGRVVAGAGRPRLFERSLAEVEREARELLSESLARQALGSSDAPPTTTPELLAFRLQLRDSRAIASFDAKLDLVRPEELERIIRVASDFETQLVDEWVRRNPAPAIGTGSEQALLEVAVGLRVRQQRTVNQILSFARNNPQVAGIETLLKRLGALDAQFDGLLRRRVLPDEERLKSVRNALQGLEGELASAREFDDVVSLSHTVSAGGEIADVDVVSDGGRTWIDTKTGPPLTTGSSRWPHLRNQAERLVRIAAHPTNWVDGHPPQLVYDFRDGVSLSVRTELERLGSDHGVDVTVRGQLEEPSA